MDQLQTETAPLPATPAPREVRLIGKCKRCKKVHRVEGGMVRDRGGKEAMVGSVRIYFWHGRWQCSLPCCSRSGDLVLLQMVKAAAVSTHKCGARCTSATGPNCECHCGGKNHGSGK